MTLPAARRLAAQLVLLLVAAQALARDAAPVLSRHDLLGWPRARADRFGCFLERELGFRDPRFNCALKRYVNQGGPCHDTDAYYEGPTFPDEKARRIHPLISQIQLSWEHGALQDVWVIFTRRLSEREVREALHLPDPGRPLPDNVMSLDISDCSKDATCLSLTGFEHIGSGDVDCSAGGG
jgi:hypothetical protein